jgi:hypothetical protein
VVRGLLGNRFVVALLVIVAVGAELAFASSGHRMAVKAGTRVPSPAHAVVSSVVRACAAPGSTAPTGGGIALAAESAGAGKAEVSRLATASSPAPATPLRVLTQPGRLIRTAIGAARVKRKSAKPAKVAAGPVPAGPARGGVMITAAGSMARGLEVEQTGPGGLATSRCGEPGTDYWFVGPGQAKTANILLYLMNTDNQPATAEVDIYTDSGPLLGSTDTGIQVPAHGMVVQSLAKLVRKSRVVALHVNTSVGRLVAALRDTARTSQPGSWLPSAQVPARNLVLPGLPAAPGTRNLYVVVPGNGNAQIKLTAVTGKGSYQPTGGSGLDLPGGSAVQVALPSLGGLAAAVRLKSNVPVTATMSVPGGAAGSPGVFTAASGPVQQQGVISGNTGKSVSIVLSAPKGAAQVRIGTQTASAAEAGSVHQVAAGKTVVVKVKAPAGAASKGFAVVLTPLAGSGPVYAGRVAGTLGKVTALLPVVSSLTSVALPPVHSSVTAALP